MSTATGPGSVGIPELKPLTESEAKILASMKEKFADKLGSIHDLTLIRFIRGYASDAAPEKKSLEMLESFIKWREEKKVDEIAATSYPKIALFDELWPTGVHGTSKCGHTIYYERVGKMEPSKIDTNFTIDEIITFHIQKMESLCRRKEALYSETDKQIYKHIAVLDLDGLGMKHTSSRFYGPLKQVIGIDQDKYPETLYCMVILNAPWVFKALWAITAPWLDPITKQRILFGNEKLTELVAPEELPKWLGGKCKCEGGKCLQVPFQSGSDKKEPRKSVIATSDRKSISVAVTTVAVTTTATTTSSSSSTTSTTTEAITTTESPSGASTASVTVSTTTSETTSG